MAVRIRRAYEPAAASDPTRFDELRRRDTEELGRRKRSCASSEKRAPRGPVTLVHAAGDAEHNDAVVLAEILRRGRRS